MICLRVFILFFNVGCFLFVGSDADCIEFIAEKRQREGIMANVRPITAAGCVEMCEDLNVCFAVNYFRLNATCQLLNMTMPESKLIKTTKCFYKAVRSPSQESIDNDLCFKLMCPWEEICMHNTTTNLAECYPFCKNPPVISGTLNDAVEIEVGQNYTYRCRDGLFGKRDQVSTVTCLRDGHWTGTNFTCETNKKSAQDHVCKTPPAKPGTITEAVEVEIGQNYTYGCQDGLIGKRDLNPTIMCLPVCTIPAKSGAIHSTAEVEIGQNYTYRCDINFFKKGDANPTITCLHDGNWTSTNFICVTQNWTLDTVYPNNIHKSEVISNQTGIHLLTCMQECDNEPTKCLPFFYDNKTGLCVLSSSFQRRLPNGFQFSDGMVYYTAPSTSCDSQYIKGTLAGSYFCIKYHTETKSFNEAMKSCESEKAKLLVVTTKNQITDIVNIWPNLNRVVYIRLSDQIEEGHWVSWNGKIVHPFWSSGEPSNNSNEDCGTVLQNSIHDIRCDLLYPFICHKIHF